MDKILRIDMEKRTARLEAVPARYRTMGGRWLTSSLIADEVPPTCHPLGPLNKVVIAPGIVTGTAAPTSSRLSVGGKSPLTGTIKEANAGTPFAAKLARLGIKAIVVEGQPAEADRFWIVKLTKDGASFLTAERWTGKDLHDIFPPLAREVGAGKDVATMAIGIAGEARMSAAGVCFGDLEGRPSRYAGRGGLGAVLGSKGLKGIVIDDAGAPGVEIADKGVFEGGRRKVAAALTSHAITKPKGALNTYGTAVLVNIINETGGLPTRNFREGRFAGATKVAGEAIFAGNKERTGKDVYNHACSPGCIIQCSNTWHKKDGTEHVSCVEYESDWAFGANCGIDDLDTIAELIRLCNGLGLDTIETGGALGVAMEGGACRFGDGKRAIEILTEIGKKTALGRVLGSGAATTGRVFGVVRVPGVKGQNMPAYEPRAIKGIGVTYATSTMGADHTAGYTICPEVLGVSGKVDPLDPDKAKLAQGFQQATAFLDATGHCLFIAFAVLDIAEGLAGMVEECNGVLGTAWTTDDIARLGAEILKIERAFNKAAGFSEVDDRLPEFMKREPLPPHNGVWDVPDKALDRVYRA